MTPSRIRTRRLLAGVIGLVALGLGAMTLIADHGTLDLISALQWVFQISAVTVGLLLTWKRPDNRIGFVIVAIVLGLALMGAGQTIGSESRDAGDIEAALWWMRTENLGFSVFVISLLVLLPLWFPTGNAASPAWAWVARSAILIGVAGLVVDFLTERTCIQWAEGQGCTRWVEGQIPIFSGELPEAIGATLFVVGLVSVVGLVTRFVKSGGVERRQMKWFVGSLAILAVSAVAAEVIDVPLDWLVWVATTLVPVSIALAILRYRLYDIDRIISRTVSYALVVGALALIFVVGVVWIPRRMPWLDGSPLLVAASTLGVAALFNPLRKRVQTWVDRRFNRSRYDAELVMESFVESLRDGAGSAELADGWVGVVTETMQPASATIWVRA